MRRTRKDAIDVAREKAVPQTPDILIPAQPAVTRAFVVRVFDQLRVADAAVAALAGWVVRRLRRVRRASGDPADVHHVRDTLAALAAGGTLAQDLGDVVAGGGHGIVWDLGGHGGGAGFDGARVHVVPAATIAW